MNVLALCAGIGGLELGIEAAGVEVTSCTYVDREPYAAAVLAARVASGALAPGRVLFGDLADLSVRPGEYDLITAGFPCQPASAAGKRLGRADERWIWPAIADIIAKCEPHTVLLENVRGLLTVDGGEACRSVLDSLAGCGLHPRWGLFRAADVGAPHRRERVFIVADAGHRLLPLAERGPEARAGTRSASEGRDVGDAADARRNVGAEDARADRGWQIEKRGRLESSRAGGPMADAERDGREGIKRAWAAPRAALGGGRAEVADADSGRREGERLAEHGDERGARGCLALGYGGDGGLAWPPGPQDAKGWRRWLDAGGPAPAVRGRLNPEFVEALMGYPPGWTDLGAGDNARRERLRCLGNAVVPAQAALAWGMLAL